MRPVLRRMHRALCGADYGERRMSPVIWGLPPAVWMTTSVPRAVLSAPCAMHRAPRIPRLGPRIPSSAWRRRTRRL